MRCKKCCSNFKDMEREVATAQRQLALLKRQRAQIEREIRILSEQQRELRTSVQDNLRVLQRVRALLEESIGEFMG